SSSLSSSSVLCSRAPRRSPVGGGRRVVVLPLGGGAVAGAVDREEAAEHGRLAATNMGRRSGGRSGDDCATTSVSTDDADSGI
ncbi:unnamed protein product, partial [Urochloa humidicola]